MKILNCNFNASVPEATTELDALKLVIAKLQTQQDEELKNTACFGNTHHALVWNMRLGYSFTGSVGLWTLDELGWSVAKPTIIAHGSPKKGWIK